MTCKNCSTSLLNENDFCGACGAKVIVNRTTLKRLISEVTNTVFGWDNKFFFTVKNLVFRPQNVLQEYLDGTRKRYMNPFTLLGLCSALAIFLFNFYADKYLALNVASNEQTSAMMANIMEQKMGADFDKEAYIEETYQSVTKMSTFTLKYFNLLIILLIPIYTLMAFIVYRKPYNYAEHLIVNCYIQGVTFIATSIIFTISVYTNPSVYLFATVFSIGYYTYAYGKLYKLTIPESILKLLIFFGILILSLLLLGIISLALGFAFAYLSNR